MPPPRVEVVHVGSAARDIAPDDPARLATSVSAYAAFTIVMTLVFGQRDWLRRGEFLSVFFGMISAFAILQRRGDDDPEISLGLPGAGLANASPLPLSSRCSGRTP